MTGVGRRVGRVRAVASLAVASLAVVSWLAMPLSGQEPSAGAESCGPGQMRVTGVVADMLSRLPLPGTAVTLEAPASYVQQIVARGTAGSGGVYAFCVDGLGEGWHAYARLDTLTSRAVPVTAGVVVDTLYIPWSQPVSFAGVVRVQGSREPLEGVRVSVEGRPVRAVTDAEGRFALRGIGAGPLVITSTLIGYAPRVDTILAESGAAMSLELTLGQEAIELDPIVVTARTPPSTRVRGIHALGMTREQVAAALPRSIDFLSMLRQANVPGLIISGGGTDGACVQFIRSSSPCAMLQVFVNGIRISNPALMVASVDPAMVEEFIVLRPAFAQFEYMGPLTPNGVLDIILK